MSDFQGSVHQVVFRWDGNQGRQGTGMKAVAHSCPAERAEELGRELGPLLWVSGTAAPRQSVVRTFSRDGEVMLVQRWPTTDPGGRPSTVSHVLIGDPRILKARFCLGLAYGGWGKRASAENASGPQEMVECAQLDELARTRLDLMQELWPTVKHALVLVTAEWLRDPAQRVSLLTDDEELPGWPDREAVPLVYHGLFMLFGRWLRQEWTFATYDTVDTHQLRLMCVPRWETDTGASGPLARLTGRKPAHVPFELWAANRLVEHLLAYPPAAPGVPQLVEGLPDGAALDWAQRRALLKDVLDTDRWSVPPPRRRPAPERGPAQKPPRGRAPETARETARETAHDTSQDSAREAAHGPVHEPAHAPLDAPLDAPVHAPVHEPVHEAPEPVAQPGPTPAPAPPPPTLPPAPEPTPAPPAPPSHPTAAPRSAAPGTGYPAADSHATRPLHEDLRAQRLNSTERSALRERLRVQSDGRLLHELRSGQLPPDALELLLDELGKERRIQERDTALQHDLCAEVLRNGLYFTPNGPGVEPISREAMTRRAAHLFTWAVAPLAHDARHLDDLQKLLHRIDRDRYPTPGSWLWQSIIAPANGRAPELPPVLWQQILRDVINRSPVPSSPPRSSPPQSPLPQSTPAQSTPPPAPLTAPVSAPVSAPPPEPRAAAPERPAFATRFAALSDRPGCVVASGFGVLAALIVIVLVIMFS